MHCSLKKNLREKNDNEFLDVVVTQEHDRFMKNNKMFFIYKQDISSFLGNLSLSGNSNSIFQYIAIWTWLEICL